MTNILLDWLKTISRKSFHIFAAVSLAAASITLLIALQLSPWLYAINIPVSLHIQAPAETKIDICWDKTQLECLPLIPYLSTEKRIAEAGETANVWLSEFPPRPTYTISLIFKSSIAKGVFQDLELDSRDVFLWGAIAGTGVPHTKLGLDQFNTKDIAYTIRDGFYYFESSPGSRLVTTQEIKSGPSNFNSGTTILLIWSLLFSIYLLFAIPIFLLPFTIQNLGSAIKNDYLPRYPWWAYLICGIAILFMLLLVINSPVMLQQSDQMVYLDGAIQQYWFAYTARPPGYYMLVALALWLSDYKLEGIVLLQAILFTLSVVICIWTLRKWLHPLIAVFVIFGMLFSPSQVHWVLSIMRESVFANLVLLGITSVIAHFTTSDKTAAKIWLAIFSVICALAIFIRENGILLPVVLLPALLPGALKRLKSPGAIWKRIQSVFLYFTPYMIPVVCTAIVYFGLSSYNYLNYGYFQFTRHVTSHRYFWQDMATANFDSRSLLEPNRLMDEEAKAYLGQSLYRSFILAREEKPRDDPIYISIFPTLHLLMFEKGQPINWFQSARIIDEIGQNSRALVPWEANLTGILRQYREFVIANPASSKNQGYPLLPDDPTGLAFKQNLLDQIKGNIAYNGKPTQPDSIIEKYYSVTQDYAWYRLLFIFAILFSLYVLRYDDPIFLAPMIFFLANALLMVMLRTEKGRYIESMDVLLILQIGLGVSRWICRSLQNFSLSDKTY